MRKSILFVCAGLVVALGGVAAAQASDRGGNRLVVTAVQTASAEVPSGGGPMGVRFVGVDDLMVEGERAGRGVRSCEFLAPELENTGTFQCLITLALPQGTVALQAMPTLTVAGFEAVNAAVTGGTGDFRHARGEALMQELSPTETRYSIDLR
jgi:hypothetical protein